MAFEVQPHPRGPWLVSVGARRLAVPAGLGRRLLRLHGRCPSPDQVAAHLRADGADDAEASLLARWLTGEVGRDESGRRGRTWIRGRVPLLPARAVRRCAGILAPWTGGAGLAAAVAVGIGGLVAGACAGPAGLPASMDAPAKAAALALFVGSALWHELGHAAALRREGYPPGGIGAGLLVVIPVLYADVTATALLPRRGRLRVDAAGPAFQFAASGVLAAAAPAAGPAWSGSLRAASAAALAAVAWSLLPFVRSDGYWMLCDALRVEELDRRPPVTAGVSVRRAAAAFRVANAAFLVLVAVALPWRLGRLAVGSGLADLLAARAGLRAAALMLGVLAFGFLWWSTARRVARLLRPPGRAAQTAGARPDPAGL